MSDSLEPVTTWNYRVVVKQTKHGEEWGIYEVYYCDGVVIAASVYPIAPTAESLGDLKFRLEKVLVAFEKPTLGHDEID